jgi:hypothetical protein
MKKIIILMLLFISCSDDSIPETEDLSCPNTTEPLNFDDFYYGPIADNIIINLDIEYFPANQTTNPDNLSGKYYDIFGDIKNVGETALSGQMHFVYNVGGERRIIITPTICSSLMPDEICQFNFRVTRNLDYIEDPNPELICFFYRLLE